MKLSVLIPVCNKEKPEHFRDAIESIVCQTEKADQILIVKDGQLSKELNEVIEIYKRKYPNELDVVQLDKQNSLGLVLNEGIKLCKNSYIARMDSDDLSRCDRFEKQKKYLKIHQDVDILGGYMQEYNENMEKVISQKKVPLTQEDIYKEITKLNPFNHSTVIVKKEAVLAIGGYKDCALEDYDLWIRMRLQNMKMANLPDILVNYRTSFNMYKRRTGIKYLKAVINIEKLLLENKLINKFQYIINILERTILALIPAKIKMFLYPKIIRKMK